MIKSPWAISMLFAFGNKVLCYNGFKVQCCNGFNWCWLRETLDTFDLCKIAVTWYLCVLLYSIPVLDFPACVIGADKDLTADALVSSLWQLVIIALHLMKSHTWPVTFKRAIGQMLASLQVSLCNLAVWSKGTRSAILCYIREDRFTPGQTACIPRLLSSCPV